MCDTNAGVTFDAVSASVGDFGWWQMWIVFALSLTRIPLAFQITEIVFIAPPINFKCVSPTNITDKCSPDCLKHEFDTSQFTSTITTEWDLVCSRSQFPYLMQTIFLLGTIFGSFSFGYLSDRYGRVKPTILAVIVQSVSNITIIFVGNFWIFMSLRFISGIAAGGIIITGFVWIVELVGINWRSAVTIYFQGVYTVGTLILITLSYYFRDWRTLHLLISAPTVILIVYVFIPESPRWLIAVGKIDQAVAVLEKGARFNGMPTEGIRENVTQGCKIRDGEKSHKGDILKLLRSSKLRVIFICVSIIWAITSLCGYGAVQYIGEMAGDIFLNITISTLVQFPPMFFCQFFLKYLGRKYSLFTYLLISGICFFLIVVIPVDQVLLAASVASLGMCFLIASCNIFILFSGELFPTVVRNVALGLSSTFGRSAGLLSPFVAGLTPIYPIVPPLIFGLSLIVGAFITLKLPETGGKNIPDTFQDYKTTKNVTLSEKEQNEKLVTNKV